MTLHWLNPQHMLARQQAAIANPQPVRAELTQRLTERLNEIKHLSSPTLHLTQEDFPSPSNHYEAIIADMLLPTVVDVPVFIHKIHHALKPGGVFLATTLGDNSFSELRQAWKESGSTTPHSIPFTDVKEVGNLLQRLQFSLPVVDRDIITLTFATFQDMYQKLRQHGIGNIHPGQYQGLTTPHQFKAMEQAYSQLFPREDQRIPLTLEVIYLHGFKHAENLPLPQKRGSGKVSLVRILGNH